MLQASNDDQRKVKFFLNHRVKKNLKNAFCAIDQTKKNIKILLGTFLEKCSEDDQKNFYFVN